MKVSFEPDVARQQEISEYLGERYPSLGTDRMDILATLIFIGRMKPQEAGYEEEWEVRTLLDEWPKVGAAVLREFVANEPQSLNSYLRVGNFPFRR